MSAYEAIMAISTKLDEEAIAALQKRFVDLISENGTVLSVDEWGRRRLAYEIQKETDGYYVLVSFESEPAFIAELERIFRITDGLLRTLVVHKEKRSEQIAEPVAETAAEEPAEAAAASVEAEE